MTRLIFCLGFLLGLTLAARETVAATVTVTAGRDNSIFSDRPNNASGQGFQIHTGPSAVQSPPNSGIPIEFRRGLIWFNVVPLIPTGATIVSAKVTMHLVEAADNGPASVDVTLWRLKADWGEGASNGIGSNRGVGMGTGRGVTALTNDATWNVRFVGAAPAAPWTTPGGDKEAAASASQTIGAPTDFISDFYSWQSSGLAADVQLWIEDPSKNFGWIALGNETIPNTTRRFSSREATYSGFGDTVFAPQLTVEYLEAAAVPEPATWGLAVMAGVLVPFMLRGRSDCESTKRR